MQASAGNVERSLVSSAAKPLRHTMPATAAFIDATRKAFGVEMIDQSIRAGIDGQPTFYAAENGQQVGTPFKNASAAPQRPACSSCQHWTRPGLSGGYCGAQRADLALAYTQGHPLRRLPQDGGANCTHYANESR